MKKFLSLLLAALIVLSFASCKSANKDSEKKDAETSTTAADSENKNEDKNGGSDISDNENLPTENHSKVLKELNKKEMKFVDSLGKTEKGKKIVAFFGDEKETQFVVAEFKNGKISLVKNYRFYKDEKSYNAYKIIAESTKLGFVDHEEEKCIEQIDTKRFSGKTYEETLEALKGYDIKK